LSTLYNAVKGRTEMTIGWASSWTDPPSPIYIGLPGGFSGW